MDITNTNGREFLVFVLGREEYAVDILKVQEIRGYEKVTPIPAAPAYLKGVMKLRDVIVPVIDMRVKLGLANPRYDNLTVVMILRLAGRVIGVVVDGVSDVVQLSHGEVKPPPHLGCLGGCGFLTGIATFGERMVLMIEIERFLSSSELDLVGRASESSQQPVTT